MEIKATVEVPDQYETVGLVFMKNGCCQGKPVVITKSKGAGIYSTQCACGGWCSNGHRTATAAVKEYERMTDGKSIWSGAGVYNKLEHLEDIITNLEEWLGND